METKTELLAPAGDRECLISALDYGCDAVYLAGKAFGMRAGARNFDGEELAEAVRLAHSRGVKVYLACNTVPLNSELEAFPRFIAQANDAGVDAVIACDLGVISMVKEYAPRLALHVSTQAGVVNYRTALELYKMGARRVVLAREVDLNGIREIRANIPEDMEIEVFVHGAMCVSFSGRCLISQYLTGRNANRGECAQPCRWSYYLMEEKRPNEFYKVEEDERGSYILNARDLCMIEHLDDLIEAGVGSFKIEGRAKSAYYVALTVNAYRTALDAAVKGERPPRWAIEEVNKISHRPYSTGFFYGTPQQGAAEQNPREITNGGQYYADSGYMRESDFAGTADSCENGIMRITQRNYFTVHDKLEIVAPGAEPIPFRPRRLINSEGAEIEIANRATEKITAVTDITVPPHSIIRKKLS